MRNYTTSLFRTLCILLTLLYSMPASAQLSYDRSAALLENSRLQKQEAISSGTTKEDNSTHCEAIPYGQALFNGTPSKSGNIIMSPKQRVAVGDRISIASWGAVQEEGVVSVDSQGFIFLKGVGPIHVEGQTEENLSNHISQEMKSVFHDGVQVYAKLEQNAGTPVLVSGGVGRPGQYYGGANDNIIVWLNRAGGISPIQGSYRNISVMRDGLELYKIDLYDFLETGHAEQITWQPGDTIVVGLPEIQVAISGDVRRCALYELPRFATIGADALNLAQPMPATTHAIIHGHRNTQPYTEVMSLEAFRRTPLEDGDRVQLYTALQNGKITVNVEGQTDGNNIIVVPKQTTLSTVLDYIPVNERVSDTSAVYLRRTSVAASQKAALDDSLNRLLQSALTAPAQSDGEALIRAKEAELIEAFVARVKGIKPEGRIVVMQGGSLRDLPLENGDTIVIPQKTNIVSIEGEVVLPRAVVIKKNAKAKDYVMMAGGFTERAMKTNFIIIRPNGDAIRGGNPEIMAGDRLLVLPKVDTKTMQTAKDLVQILYQVAVGAGVLLTINN